MARSWIVWATVLGVAVGGFFDGILLHQILQWHHLFSLVEGIGDLRAQILWDGWFHALMYLLAAIALTGLWRAHSRGAARWGRPLVAGLLVGFGLWHILDSMLSHWVLGIHRIRVDSADPLVWDLLWFVVFGLAPVAIAVLIARGTAGRPPMRPATAALAVLTVATGSLAWWSMQAPAGAASFTTVVFRPDHGPAEVAAALANADARLVWGTADLGVVVVEVSAPNAWRFYRNGALLVSGAGVPAGCAAWTRV